MVIRILVFMVHGLFFRDERVGGGWRREGRRKDLEFRTYGYRMYGLV